MYGVLFPGGEKDNGYQPTNPVVGMDAEYCETENCTRVLSYEWFNSVASEIVAVTDKLGFSYDPNKNTNVADAIASVIHDATIGLASEIAARTAADDALSADLVNEVAARILGYDQLFALLSSETNDRINGFNGLSANKADKLITIVGSGLATGGGNLLFNRVIDVQAATQLEAIDGTRNDVAITPFSLSGAIANLYNSIVGAPPAALNTLLELADALNNDPNFADTIMAALATEASTRANADNVLQTNINSLQSRVIGTSGLVTGGGDLSANRTLTVMASTNAQGQVGTDTTTAMTPASTTAHFNQRWVQFTETSSGIVPSSGGGTTNFLRADGAWVPPPSTPVATVAAASIV